MAALSGIINNAVAGAKAKLQPEQEDIMAPAQPAPATTVAPTGIIGMAAQTPQAAPAPAQPNFTSYNGQQVATDQTIKDNMTSGAESWNKSQGTNLTAQEYDKMLNPTTYGARWGVDASQMAAPGAPPAPSANNGQVANPAKWDVTKNQTVQGQMADMIDPNSPFYQKWAAAGAQDAAARGFTGNSTIRDTGIIDSVMRNATPIATADASTFAKAGGYNADEQNQFAFKNADAQNTMAQARLSSDTQKFVAGLSADTQQKVATLNNDSQKLISQAHDANSALLASNSQAKDAYSNYVAAVAQIDQNDKMTGEDAKRNAIITQTQIFNAAIAALKANNPGIADVSSPLDITQAVSQVGGEDVSDLLKGF